MALFVFLTGAAGSGKTHLVRLLEEKFTESFPRGTVHFAYFDNIGVPSDEEIELTFGSREKWAEHATHEWVERLLEHEEKKLVLLEGRFDPESVLAACRKRGIKKPLILCAHTNRVIRERRLVDQRRQPELATQEMQNWADTIRKKTVELGGTVIDTSPADPGRAMEQALIAISERLKIPQTGDAA